MAAPTPSVNRRPAAARDATSLLVTQRGSAVADGLERGLRALGVPITLVATPYDAVTEAAGRAEPVERLIVGVDFMGPDEFRILPLFRREWPDTCIVAYHSPGFEHKGRIAELVGADLVVAGPEALSRFLRMVVSTRPPRPSRATVATPRSSPAAPSSGPGVAAPVRPQHAEAEAALARPAQRPAQPRHPSRPAPASWTRSAEPDAKADMHPAFADALRQGPVRPEVRASAEPVGPAAARAAPASPAPAPAPPAPAASALVPPLAPKSPTEPPHEDIENLDADDDLARGRVLGTVELTEEELRLLLGEDDDQ